MWACVPAWEREGQQTPGGGRAEEFFPFSEFTSFLDGYRPKRDDESAP